MNGDFNIDKYKLDVTKHDILLIKKVMRPKAWENIPIIGGFAYIIRMKYAYLGIDRGLLRKELWKWHFIFTLGGLIYGAGALMLLTPWFFYLQVNIAIKKTEEIMNNNKL